MHVCFNKLRTWIWKKLIKINSEAQNKFNNSVKEPEEAGLFGSGPRENQFIYLYPDNFASNMERSGCLRAII